jgi:branched-chain amino acid transport system substrate-binding protein
MKRCAIALLLASLALFAAACGGSSSGSETSGSAGAASTTSGGGGSDQGPIKVGVVVPLTGPFTPLGQGDKQGIEIAQQQINASGGVNGRKVQFIIKDDQTKPDQAVIAYNQLKSQDVVAVLGSSSSNSTNAIAPLAQRDGLPLITLSPVDQLVDPVQSNVFVEPYLSKLQTERLMQYFKSEGITKLAVVYDKGDVYTKNGFDATVAQASGAGVTIVDKEPITAEATDFSSTLTHVKSSGAQAVLAWITGPPSVILAKQFQAAGLASSMKMVMTESDATDLFLKPAGAAANGIVMTCTPANIGESLPDGPIKDAYEQLAKGFDQRYGGQPSAFASNSWTAAQILFSAIKSASDTSPEALQKALEGVSVFGSDGKYEFSASQHAGAVVDDVMVVEVKDGKFVPTDFQKQQFSSLPS